ncbi:hypothetical protein QJS04_geneDACA000782 [Acorus gramineus]|uniref:Endoplasmic reticulum transmembrane protein n=1 Tax=Acorus gramineus TaxID=55184 RepID=A0AAV9BGT7_ACOGR|nr:hypothetical protein QJS04_geneDACA000782 [Acorus gramineus]
MIQLLFTLLGGEALVVFALLVRSPLRKLAIMGLDRAKRGRGPVIVQTVTVTILIVLSSSVFSMVKIMNRSADPEGGGVATPTDQVLMSRHLLESTLMGYFLFLALLIDRLHHYIKEIRRLRKGMEAAMKQNSVLEEAKSGSLEELKARERELEKLSAKIKQLESESEARLTEVKAAEANAVALKKQSEGFLLEYDRLVEENQNLRNQLQSIDLSLSQSDGKNM